MEGSNGLGVRVKKGKGIKYSPPAGKANKKIVKSNFVLTDERLADLAAKILKQKLYGQDNYRSAVISHCVVTGKKKFKKDSIRYVKDILHEYDEVLSNAVAENALQYLIRLDKPVFPKPENPKFTFIDLFAGIGGFRLAMQSLGGECVFTSEWDKDAQKTYQANFGEIPFGDITKDEIKQWIPRKFDLLCAGFPCQPFSIAGVSKKNSLGRKHGFDDEKQGNLFFHIADIIQKHRPRAFFLENVKNLVSHDKGNTFKVIRYTLEELGYSFHTKVMNGKHFVPQHRERTFIIGFDKSRFGKDIRFDFPDLPDPAKKIKDILEPKVEEKYTLTEHLWKYLQDYAKKHKEKGNGFGYGLADLNGISRTLSARYYKDGSEILIPQKGSTPRRLSIRECARLQGYPDNFIVSAVSMNQGYKQFGNSVVVPLIQSIGEKVIENLLAKK